MYKVGEYGNRADLNVHVMSKLLPDRFYAYLARRPEQWVRRYDLDRKAQQKGYGTEVIRAAFASLREYPDVGMVWVGKNDKRPYISGGYGEYWRVVPMSEAEKETHRHAHEVFASL